MQRLWQRELSWQRRGPGFLGVTGVISLAPYKCSGSASLLLGPASTAGRPGLGVCILLDACIALCGVCGAVTLVLGPLCSACSVAFLGCLGWWCVGFAYPSISLSASYGLVSYSLSCYWYVLVSCIPCQVSVERR